MRFACYEEHLMYVYGGYATTYGQEAVRMRARFAAKAIKELMAETDADCVVVHGNSGVSCGFAALMYGNFPLILLRKDNDNSHGMPMEGPNGHNVLRYLILDDFIDTGATMERIKAKIVTLAEQSRDGLPRPECVGIVLYGHHRGDGFSFRDGQRVPVRVRQ